VRVSRAVVLLAVQLLALVSLSVWATRLVLGYLRMDDRYKSIVAQLLAGETAGLRWRAGGGGGAQQHCSWWVCVYVKFGSTYPAQLLAGETAGPSWEGGGRRGRAVHCSTALGGFVCLTGLPALVFKPVTQVKICTQHDSIARHVTAAHNGQLSDSAF
jgi:hypothetical protein